MNPPWPRRPLRKRRVLEPLCEVVSEANEVSLGQRNEHLRKRGGRKVAQGPSQDARVDAGVLSQGKWQIALRRVARPVEEQKVHAIARLGA